MGRVRPLDTILSTLHGLSQSWS
uniref:Uncharacterized protein n=1 Tax=Rhizophora mucronata TaxID=61149 RepID=A0A2P2NE00_RHIMU